MTPSARPSNEALRMYSRSTQAAPQCNELRREESRIRPQRGVDVTASDKIPTRPVENFLIIPAGEAIHRKVSGCPQEVRRGLLPYPREILGVEIRNHLVVLASEKASGGVS